MSYQVLARKWRPRNFTELVGQEHVRQALTNALDNDRLHHAFLFTGTRGVGKTTIARILAKSLNCEQGVSSTPCGVCPTCVEINEGRFVDLIEVDAASRTKVDETRELLENVQYAPSRGRYKVYLIDEVHMFSNHSFNALLKTLEEPPPHVKFLLATTDPQRLPVTILSRCLQFNLKRLSPELIRNHLAKVLTAEDIEHETAALRLIARAADGSMRDALSLLDQAIAFGAGALREAEVRSMLGSIEQHHVIELLQALAAGDAGALLTRVAALAEHSPDFAGVLAELISTLHRIALAQAAADAVDDEMDDRESVLALAERLSPEDVQLYYQIALIGRRDLPLAPTQRGGFEMILLRMLAFRPDAAALDAGGSRPGRGRSTASDHTHAPAPTAAEARGESPLAAMRSQLTGKPPAGPKAGRSAALDTPASAAPAKQATTTAPAAKPAPPPARQQMAGEETPPMPDYLQETIPPAEEYAVADAPPAMAQAPAASAIPDVPEADAWERLLDALTLEGLTAQLALNCALKQHDGARLALSLAPAHRQLLNQAREAQLAEALSRHLGEPVSLSITVEATAAPSPAARRELVRLARQRQAEASIAEDHGVQALRETFGAQVNPGSVSPVE